MPAMIELKDITKRYGAVTVFENITLAIAEGGFTSLLGASGSGKTTLLNLIAGLDWPTSGELAIGGTTVFSGARGVAVPPQKREIGYVFQSYALWPHMRAIDNVAYPLRARGVKKSERHKAAQELLARLDIGHLADRFPFALSGGQQQRVAIARALIHHPRVLLLDEPLSSLDVQLRERARAWLAKVHAEFQLTTVLVTHDHVEALSLSDRVVLLKGGHIEQDGAPGEIFERPLTAYVADFVGGANALDGHVEACADSGNGGYATTLRLAGNHVIIVNGLQARAAGRIARVVVRPQRVEVLATERKAATGAEVVVPMRVTSALYRGNDWEVVGTTPLGEVSVISPTRPPGEDIFVRFAAADCCLVDS